MSAWLEASHLRVDVGGAPAIDGLSLAAGGDHVLVLGAARALFGAAAGLRRVTRGDLLVDGRPAAQAVRAGAAACAPLDPPLPPSWSVLEYATWSARVAGQPRRAARELAGEALARMRLTAAAATRLSAAPPVVRRALGVAAALATGARVLLVEDPVGGLPDEAAHLLARTIARAVEDLRTAVFAGRVALESPLALAADEAVVIDGSHVVAQGAPGEIAAGERTLALRVLGDFEAFARAVDASGGRAQVSSGAPPAAHVRVDLGPLAARDLLRIAASSNAVVVELRPIARSFA